MFIYVFWGHWKGSQWHRKVLDFGGGEARSMLTVNAVHILVPSVLFCFFFLEGRGLMGQLLPLTPQTHCLRGQKRSFNFSPC